MLPERETASEQASAFLGKEALGSLSDSHGNLGGSLLLTALLRTFKALL